jgi:hypothetical protein
VSYVYIRSDRELWTVGFYTPDGRWQSESDHDSREEAAERVAWLNGSVDINERLPGRQFLLDGRLVTVTPYTGQSGDALKHSPNAKTSKTDL